MKTSPLKNKRTAANFAKSLESKTNEIREELDPESSWKEWMNAVKAVEETVKKDDDETMRRKKF